MLFEIRNLTKCYKNRTVLDIEQLDFEKGHIYALLGPNGSGKTTLLEILGLLNRPDTGMVKYNGRTINYNTNHLYRLRRNIALVQQNPVLFSTSVYKNLEFGLKIRRIPKIKRRRMIEETLELVAMEDFKNTDATKLSGGETQRIAIARALVYSPKVIFFDEPTANVDVENQVAIEKIIFEINLQKKISVILTTHNFIQASNLSHKIISLNQGRLTS